MRRTGHYPAQIPPWICALPLLTTAACGNAELDIEISIAEAYLSDKACLEECDAALEPCLDICSTIHDRCTDACLPADEVCLDACEGWIDVCKNPGDQALACSTLAANCSWRCPTGEDCSVVCEQLASDCETSADLRNLVEICFDWLPSCLGLPPGPEPTSTFCDDMVGDCVSRSSPPKPDRVYCESIWKSCVAGCQSVTRIELSLYQPPAGKTFGCTELAFGLVSEEVLTASLTATVNFEADNPAEQKPLTGVDRYADKVLLAEGLAADETVLVAACAELSTIATATKVQLETVPTAELTISPLEGITEAAQIVAGARDPVGRPLVGRTVRYEGLGPSGWQVSGETMSDSTGLVLLNTENPNLPGPFQVTLRALWQRGPAAVVSELAAAETASAELDGIFYGAVHAGDLGGAGAGLAFASARGGEFFAHWLNWNDERLAVGHSTALLTTRIWLGITSSRPHDRIILFRAHEWAIENYWAELHLDTGATSEWRPTADFGLIVRNFPAESCANPDLAEIIMQHEDNTLVTHSLVALGEPDTRIFATLTAHGACQVAACVADQFGLEHRLFVCEGRRAGQREVLLDYPGGAVASPLDGFYGELAASPAQAGQRMLLASGVDNTGAVLSRLRAEVGEAGEFGFRLVTFDTVPVATLPTRLAAGDLDHDGSLDWVSLFSMEESGHTIYYLQMVMGQPAGGKLQGRLRIGASDDRPGLVVRDLDGDQYDDIVLLLTQHEPWPKTEVQVWRMGLTAK